MWPRKTLDVELKLVEGPNLEKDDKENITTNIEMMETIHDDIMTQIWCNFDYSLEIRFLYY
jgi:hypothetical protein